MRPRNDVEILIDGRRKQLGIGRKELALATVGSQTTWTSRMLNPLMFRHEETQRLFRYLDFTQEKRREFYEAMDWLGEVAK